MQKKDVILTAFTNSSQAPYSKWAGRYFPNPPIIISIPGSGGSKFRSKIRELARTGDIFSAALAQFYPQEKIEIGKRGLITFSVGGSVADELLKIETERNKLNALLVLDGCHERQLSHWIDFAEKAASLEAWMTMAHSSIVPPNFPSTISTNSKIFWDASLRLNENISKPLTKQIPPLYILQPSFPNEIKISLAGSKNLPAISKVWTKDSLINWENIGNLTRFHYAGNDRCDHVYIAWHVAERMFRWLSEEWQ